MPPIRSPRLARAMRTFACGSDGNGVGTQDILSIKSTEDDTWTTGDFTLVSSDLVIFKIESYHILSASPVFGAASTARPGEQHIEFADPKLETAFVLRLFLSLATTATLGHSFTPSAALEHQDSNLTLLPLIAFLQKYDAMRVLRAALSCIDRLVSTGKMTAYAGLILGAAANDVPTCVAALSTKDTRFPHPGPDDAVHCAGPNRSTVNPRGFPYDVWRTLSPQYTWALTRGWIPGQTDGFPTRFDRLIKLAKEHDGELNVE
ncbi:hypothetical protein CspeluHIS016_0900950 [Cutaneotrichosporon spelunceum]|uniref:BTB domain-containing protein n=1 Tax=Cutaneotrichosporon spelunceum TaxID=1672016 RepID=A0AAD3TZR2_9TREE|nr:hypothetical protein CspeluHIS016_0900950 [Cutaneotrichosporon spelunceum]